jgi:hypothetical protein
MASDRDLVKGSAVAVENRVLFRIGLPAADRDVEIGRLVFDPIAAAADLLGRHRRRARTQKGVEDKIALRRAIAHRVGHQRDRLDRRVHGEGVVAAGAKAIDAGILPNIGPAAPVPATLDIVLMGRLASAEHGDQLVLAAIERPLPRVPLVPDRQVDHGRINLPPDVDQLADMAPVHADEVQAPLTREAGGMAEAKAQEGAELAVGHLAAGEGEFGVTDLPAPLHMAGDPNVIGRVGEDHIGAPVPHQARIVRLLPGVAAQNPMLAEEPEIAPTGNSDPFIRRKGILRLGFLVAHV